MFIFFFFLSALCIAIFGISLEFWLIRLYYFWKNCDRIAETKKQVPSLITANHHENCILSTKFLANPPGKSLRLQFWMFSSANEIDWSHGIMVGCDCIKRDCRIEIPEAWMPIIIKQTTQQQENSGWNNGGLRCTNHIHLRGINDAVLSVELIA